MDWTKSYTAIWRVFRVNRKTWADAEPLSMVDSVSLSKTADGSLIESGGMKLAGDFEADYYRLVMIAQQGDVSERVDVATLLFNSDGGDYNYGRTEYDVDGYSVLFPASTKSVTIGSYAPAYVDGAQYAKELLEDAINAPVEVDGSFYLNDHVVHEVGASVLEAVWSVLDAGNFVMQIDGRGTVHIMPKPTEPAVVINSDNYGLLKNGVNYTADMSELPNRYVVIDENNVTVVENNDDASPISIQNRGFYVDLVDTSPTPVNGETMNDYAVRMLIQESTLNEERSYTREFIPNINPYSIIRGSVGGLSGDFRIKSQTITCNRGILINEKVTRETKLWQG